MALPKLTGDNPEKVELTKDAWTLVAENVNAAKLNSDFNATQLVFMTYLKTGDSPPIGLTVPKWSIPAAGVRFEDSATARDLYVFPKTQNAEITIEV